MSIWDTLRSIINARFSIIQKGKKYVKPGQTPPKGVQLHKGPNGGIYYFVEDKHVKQAGKYHELIRSKGVTKDQFASIEEKFKAQGAESVHFVHKPGLEKTKGGQNLYNIYVNWGEKTQTKIQAKKQADKEKFGRKTIHDFEEPNFTESDGIHTTPAYDRIRAGYVENGRYEIHPSGSHGAKLYYIDKQGTPNKITYSYDKVWGDKSETDIDEEKSRERNIDSLKKTVKDLTRAGPTRRNYLIANMKRLDEEKAAKPEKKKEPAKNPLWEIHNTLRSLIDAHKAKTSVLDIPELRHDPMAMLQDSLDKWRNTPGKVEQIENEEAAMQHKRGNTPVREFLANHLKKHYPDASEDQIQDAARTGNSYHANGRQRLSDSYHYAATKLSRLMKQPAQPVLPSVQKKPVEKEPDVPAEPEASTETSYKDPRVAGAAMGAMQARGYDAEVLQNDWQKDKGHIIRVKYTKKPDKGPEVPGPVTKPGKSPTKKPVPKKEKPFVRKYQVTSPEAAQKRKEELESKGHEVKVVEKKFGNRTIYDILHRTRPQQNSPDVSLPMDETGAVRTWMRRIDGHVSGATHNNIGDWVYPTRTEGGKHYYSLPDGLYHGNMGSRSMNPEGEKYYLVQNGAVREIPEGERAATIRSHTPEINRAQFDEFMAQKVQNVKEHSEAAKGQNKPVSIMFIGNTHPRMAEKLKDKYHAKWNPESKHWYFFSSQPHEDLSRSLSKDFGPDVVTRSEKEWFQELGHKQQMSESIGRMSKEIQQAYIAAGRPQDAFKGIKTAEQMFNDAESEAQSSGQKGAKSYVSNPYLHDRWYRTDQIIKQVVDRLKQGASAAAAG
jgi:hypothetical protein